MRLTRAQIHTLAWICSHDASPGVELRTVRGALMVRWQDAAGVEARMALGADGKLRNVRGRGRE